MSVTDWRNKRFIPAFEAGLRNIYATNEGVSTTSTIGFVDQRRPAMNGIDLRRIIAADLHSGEVVAADKFDRQHYREFVGTAADDTPEYRETYADAQQIVDEWQGKHPA
jgi:hypothetical protein